MYLIYRQFNNLFSVGFVLYLEVAQTAKVWLYKNNLHLGMGFIN